MTHAWQALFPPWDDEPIQGRMAAPTARIAMLYADDRLLARGCTGPGMIALPEDLPPLRFRKTVHLPSEHEPSVLEEAAQCECGFASTEMVDRYELCPRCGGTEILPIERLAPFAEKYA